VKRQAARFRIYVYDTASPGGRELKIGETIQVVLPKTGQLLEGTVKGVTWTVYLANKKAAWYEFEQLQGEHGYLPGHPLRNADVQGTTARQRLIIDPEPQSVTFTPKKADRIKRFAKGENPGTAQSFPPPLQPNSIETLGEIRATKQNNHDRLPVLGGHGNAGYLDKRRHIYREAMRWPDSVFWRRRHAPVTLDPHTLLTRADRHTGKPCLLSSAQLRSPCDSCRHPIPAHQLIRRYEENFGVADWRLIQAVEHLIASGTLAARAPAEAETIA